MVNGSRTTVETLLEYGEEIKASYLEEKLTVAQISAKFDSCRPTMMKVMDQLGIKRRRTSIDFGTVNTSIHPSWTRKLQEKSLSLSLLSEYSGIPYSTISKNLSGVSFTSLKTAITLLRVLDYQSEETDIGLCILENLALSPNDRIESFEKSFNTHLELSEIYDIDGLSKVCNIPKTTLIRNFNLGNISVGNALNILRVLKKPIVPFTEPIRLLEDLQHHYESKNTK
jgi:predicted transcriptional regulator